RSRFGTSRAPTGTGACRHEVGNAYILSGNKELTKQIGLRSSRRTPLYNGSLPCTLLKYELY
ncbi:MAG: hypothetical protein ACKO7A_18630, partial [Microcystis sp.]